LRIINFNYLTKVYKNMQKNGGKRENQVIHPPRPYTFTPVAFPLTLALDLFLGFKRTLRLGDGF
jgi:hypothetical protein